jgi:serine O-acetyltransferase
MRLEDRGRNLRATVTADMQRYVGTDCRPWGVTFLRRMAHAGYEHPGLLAVLVYRYGQWTVFRCRVPVLKQLCDAYYYLLYHWVRTRLQIEVPRTTAIGAGLRIDHFGGIIINSCLTAGRNLWVKPGVVIGQTDTGFPCIGDDVEIGVGAKVIGGIRVGSNVIIGAQALVCRDVPDNVVVAGVPARVLRSRTMPVPCEDAHEEG